MAPDFATMAKDQSDRTSRRSEETRRLGALLEGFTSARRTCGRGERADAARSSVTLSGLLKGFVTSREVWRKSQEAKADDFSVLEVLGVADEEVRYSMLLAWLLDHRIGGLGTHAQGNL